MPIANTPKGPVLFVHVPKTGGSSVEDYLARRFGQLWLDEADYHDRRDNKPDIIQSIAHLSARDLAALLPPNLVYSFAVVRDPLKRLQSEYRFQRGISTASRLDFSTWARAMIFAASTDPRIYENHIRPQSQMVPENAEAFRLEDGLDRAIKQVDAHAGAPETPVEMQHLLKTESVPIQVYADDVALISMYYSEDYQRFGYNPPDPNAYPKDRLALARTAVGRTAAALILRQHRRRIMGKLG